MFTNIYTHLYIYINVQNCIYQSMSARVYVCMYIYIHLHYTHTCMRMPTNRYNLVCVCECAHAIGLRICAQWTPACMHVHMPTCHQLIQVCTCARASICAYLRICSCTCVCVCVIACAHVHMALFIMCIYIYTHIYIYIRILMHLHIRLQRLSFPCSAACAHIANLLRTRTKAGLVSLCAQKGRMIQRLI